METRIKRDNYTLIHYRLSPLERLQNIGRAIEIKRRLEEERKNRKMSRADKIRFKMSVEKFYKDMENYLDNISYK
jgi:hypothetical protein